MTASHPSHPSRPPLLAGIAVCAASALCFGSLGVLGVFIMRTGTPRSTMIAWRFILAAVVLAAYVVVSRRRFGRGRQLWQPLLVGGVYGAMTTCYFVAVTHTTAGLAALLLYTMPVYVVLLGIVRRTQLLTRTILVAVVLAVSGVAISLLGAETRLSAIGLIGGFLSGVLFAGYYTGIDTLPAHTDRIAASTLVCIGAAVAATTFSLTRGEFGLPEPAAYVWQITMALVCTVAAIALLNVGILMAGASVAAVISCLEPISSVLLGAIVLGEAFGPPQWLGTTAVVAAVVLLSLPTRRPSLHIKRVSSPS